VEIDERDRGRGHVLEHAREASDVAHERFRLDLLAQIGVRIAPKVGGALLRRISVPDAWQHAVRERPLDIEVRSELLGDERRQSMHMNSARQEIGLFAPQLVCAASGQEEAEAPRHLVENDLHDVEQRGHALYFVEEYVRSFSGAARKLLSSRLRTRHVLAIRRGAMPD